MSLSYVTDTEGDELTYRLAVQTLFESFRRDVMILNYDGRNCSAMGRAAGVPYKWNLFGFMLFSTTIMTTIGELLYIGLLYAAQKTAF